MERFPWVPAGSVEPPRNGSACASPGAGGNLREFFSSDKCFEGVLPRSDLAGLAALQGSIMRNYFRLLRVQEELERRTRATRAGRAATVLDHVEEERERLAHELHASAGQALAGIKIHLELIDSFLKEPPEQVRTSLHRIGLLAQEALQQLRSIAHRIHPPDWERNTLAEALGRLWETTGIPQKFEAQLELDELGAEPSPHIRILLYRVAQEAIANAVRHASATRLRLRLASSGANRLQLTVEDNGKGFDPTSPGTGGGIGLASMRTHLREAGGELQVESGPLGTRLTAWVPASET